MSKAKKQSSKSTSAEVWRSVEVYSYQSETVTTSTTVEEHYVSYQTAKPTKRKWKQKKRIQMKYESISLYLFTKCNEK